MCIFDEPKELFNYIEIERGKRLKCERWIDYEDKDGKILWYAILNQIPYIEGHTLVILGSHKERIYADDIPQEEFCSMILGVNRISKRLKDILKVENVHVLSMCEQMQHLHFHLLPRPKEYDQDQIEYMKDHYFKRKKIENPQISFEEFSFKVDNNLTDYHGMWYSAFLEQNPLHLQWKYPEDYVRELDKTAASLRNKTKTNPFLD